MDELGWCYNDVTHSTERTLASCCRCFSNAALDAPVPSSLCLHKFSHARRSGLPASKWTHGRSSIHSANSAAARSGGMVESSTKWYGRNWSDTCTVMVSKVRVASMGLSVRIGQPEVRRCGFQARRIAVSYYMTAALVSGCPVHVAHSLQDAALHGFAQNKVCHNRTLRYRAMRGTENTSSSYVVGANAADGDRGRAICDRRGLARAAGVGSDVRPNTSLTEGGKQGRTRHNPGHEQLCGLCGSSVHDRVVRNEQNPSIPPTGGKER